jgi:hypothetical protein
LADLGITLDPKLRTAGRVRAQQQLILKVYERSAIELSQFAPLVFAAMDDAVAQDIIDRAAGWLAQTLLAVSHQEDREISGAGTGPGDSGQTGLAVAGPLVFGGSVLTKATAVAAAVLARLAVAAPLPPVAPVMVDDGVVGSAILVLKRHGIKVDQAVFTRVQESLAMLRG